MVDFKMQLFLSFLSIRKYKSKKLLTYKVVLEKWKMYEFEV